MEEWNTTGLYYWLWHDVCRRPEPFTYTMRRSAREHPLYWIFIPIGVGAGWWALATHLWGIY